MKNPPKKDPDEGSRTKTSLRSYPRGGCAEGGRRSKGCKDPSPQVKQNGRRVAHLPQGQGSESLQRQLSASEEALCAALLATRAGGRASPRSGRQPVSQGLRHRSQASPLPLGKRRPLLSFLSSLGKPTPKFHCCGSPTVPRCLALWSTFSSAPHFPSGPYLCHLILNSSHLCTCPSPPVEPLFPLRGSQVDTELCVLQVCGS